MNETAPSFPIRLWRSLALLLFLTLQHLVITAACMLCLQVLLILFSGFHPWLELGVHFVVHGLLAALVIMPILWITKHKRTAAVCMLVAAYFIFLLRPWIFLLPAAQPQADAVRVMSWNVWATNNDLDEIERVIRRADPDILVLIEVRPNLVEQVPYLATQFPNSQVLPHWGGMGIGVFSKRPDVEFSIERFVIKMMPSIVTTIKSSDRTRSVELVGMHTFSPQPPQRALVRDQQIAALSRWAADRAGPICLVGDLNTTPWSRSFQRLEKIGFRDSRIGTGNCASWPSWLGSLGIPIDHALTLGSCSVTNRRVITDVRGSDHFPIQFDLSF